MKQNPAKQIKAFVIAIALLRKAELKDLVQCKSQMGLLPNPLRRQTLSSSSWSRCIAQSSTTAGTAPPALISCCLWEKQEACSVWSGEPERKTREMAGLYLTPSSSKFTINYSASMSGIAMELRRQQKDGKVLRDSFLKKNGYSWISCAHAHVHTLRRQRNCLFSSLAH